MSIYHALRTLSAAAKPNAVFILRRTYSTKLVKSGKPDKKLDKKKPVLVERRIINHKGQHTHTEVDVKSPALRDLLIEINKDVEGLSLKKEPPFVRNRAGQLAFFMLIIDSRRIPLSSSTQDLHSKTDLLRNKRQRPQTLPWYRILRPPSNMWMRSMAITSPVWKTCSRIMKSPGSYYGLYSGRTL